MAPGDRVQEVMKAAVKARGESRVKSKAGGRLINSVVQPSLA